MGEQGTGIEVDRVSARGLNHRYASRQELGMCRAFLAGLCIVDVDRVDANEDRACLDQIGRGGSAEERCAGDVSRSAEVSIPAGMQQHGGAPPAFGPINFQNNE